MTRLHAVILKVREANNMNMQERTFEEFERMVTKRLGNVFKPITARTAEHEAQTDLEKGTVEDSSTQTDPANPASETVGIDLNPKIDQAEKNIISKTEVEKEVCSLCQPAISSISIPVEKEEVPTTENEAVTIAIALEPSNAHQVQIRTCSLPPLMVRTSLSSSASIPVCDRGDSSTEVDEPTTVAAPLVPKKICSLPPIMLRPTPYSLIRCGHTNI